MVEFSSTGLYPVFLWFVEGIKQGDEKGYTHVTRMCFSTRLPRDDLKAKRTGLPRGRASVVESNS